MCRRCYRFSCVMGLFQAFLKQELCRIASARNCELLGYSEKGLPEKSGFLSIISLVTASLSNGEELHLVSKSSVIEHNGFTDVDTCRELSEVELYFFEKIYPELLEMVKQLNLPDPFPTVHFSGKDAEGSVVFLFEDLTHRGLTMPKLENTLSEGEVDEILVSSAVLEVSVLALQLKKGKGMKELFPVLTVSHDDVMFGFVSQAHDHFIDDLKQYESNWTRFVDVVNSLKSTPLSDGYPEVDENYTFFCHGDLWVNNIFMNDKECKWIDWQCITRGSVCDDIGTFVLSCIDTNGGDAVCIVQKYVNRVAELVDKFAGDEGLRAVAKSMFHKALEKENLKRSLLISSRMMIASWSVWREFADHVMLRTLHNICNFLDFVIQE